MALSPQDLVNREVYYCVSHLILTLATGYGQLQNADRMRENSRLAPGADLSALCEQAFELCAPIPDYDEAAIQDGWRKNDDGKWRHPGAAPADAFASAEEVCGALGLDPYEREILEHWIVSDWLADKLEAKGEKVDKDFAGMTIWARTTTGQSIANDSVIEKICAEINASNVETCEGNRS